MEKKLKCTLSFTDAHLIDAEDLVQNPEEQSLAFDEMIISHLKKKYYPSLNIDIDITNHEGEFVDFDACVSFECAGLRQYVDSVKALIWCQLGTESRFDAYFGVNEEYCLTEEEFDVHGNIDQAWYIKHNLQMKYQELEDAVKSATNDMQVYSPSFNSLCAMRNSLGQSKQELENIQFEIRPDDQQYQLRIP